VGASGRLGVPNTLVHNPWHHGGAASRTRTLYMLWGLDLAATSTAYAMADMPCRPPLRAVVEVRGVYEEPQEVPMQSTEYLDVAGAAATLKLMLRFAEYTGSLRRFPCNPMNISPRPPQPGS
jgi:hypothetical protein